MMRAALLAALLLLLPLAARAVEPKPFDYWLLALSWLPQFCAGEEAGNDPQCTSKRRYGFIVHGLWPQLERGYPKNCPRPAKLPDSTIQRMLPLMPSPRLIQHEWNKHGACTGWAPSQYFHKLEAARASVRIPQAYQGPQDYLNTSLKELERQFIAANPRHSASSIAAQCSGRWLREVRLCFTKDLSPRACGPDVRDACGSGQIVLRPAK